LLACDQTGEAVLIDPGAEAPRLIAAIDRLKTSSGLPIRVKHLLHTHAHFDHFGATRELRDHFSDSKIRLHSDDLELYQTLPMQGQMFGFRFDEPRPVDQKLEDEETISFGSLSLSVLHTPGHSPGGVCFRLQEDSALKTDERVFSGDTLFQGSVGRTDLWGADGDQMIRSIRERLLTLDGDTCVCPGHGPDTKIGIEKRSNPYLR
jgi:glyoxylase-like metal-dependent hydrolase (beta-lactamase superfamily II)